MLVTGTRPGTPDEPLQREAGRIGGVSRSSIRKGVSPSGTAPQPKGPASLPTKVQLTTTVRDFSGSPYPKGSVLEARMAPDGALEVVGAQHLSLRPHEWSLVLTDDDFERLLADE